METERTPRGGRPTLRPGEASTVTSVRLSATTYDELYAAARAAGEDVSTFIRTAIDQRLVVERRQTSR